MGLEAVKEEILSTAKEQANSLIAEARKEANRIMKEADKAIEAMKEKSEAETKKAVDIIKRQEVASADLDNKKKALEAKKQVIESVFEEAKKMCLNDTWIVVSGSDLSVFTSSMVTNHA